MDQFWLLGDFMVGLLNLPVSVTMFTVLAFVANLNGFSMLALTSGTKNIFRLHQNPGENLKNYFEMASKNYRIKWLKCQKDIDI